MELKEETKRNIARNFGVDYETLVNMSPEEQENLVESIIGHKPRVPNGARIDGCRVVSLEEVEKKVDFSRKDRKDRKEKPLER